MLVGALPPALISLLLVASRVSAAPYDFLDNYRDPTPAADEGPPASYQAVRDKNVLPYEICGVVGGYVFTVLIWGVLLLTVGRKMRRKALDPPKQLELELQDKPTLPALRTAGLTSPPLSARSFFGKFKRNRNDSAVSNPQSPVVQSPSSFDQKVVDAHRGQDQADMERLYAAVMDFDERKHSSKVSVEETEPIPRPTERRRPSNISIARPESHSETPISPVKAIYPPNYSVQQPAAPTHSTHLRADAHPPPSPRSILSKRSQNSNTNSTGSKNARFNLKNLRISGPIAKYPGADSDDEARTPLSPRFYANPGVPPSPPTQTNSPTSPEQYTEEALDSVQPLPRPAPQRLGLGPPPTSQPPSTSTTRQQPPKPLSPPTSLPLRSFASPLASPGIQTTVLDRRVEALALGTPKTGVPFTPYSPYMPFTPITPVTPHLTTRKERKMEKKEGRKYGSRKPRVEEELVQSPKEIFGDGW
ncbi:uncharacterized protein J4E79_007103 [Alternaria viburni]|uniref:uncharacterized protein n=1 Tax=Alternaria viburni TaxID=566460 RepID=UPI0020C3CD60|nr:uncharacterized protein J4E79_007103 [Alternaria viburni]KAI4658122.1 hypothetical protein J4E79_007103 [Alternaria viburni]